jgi:hypothetical protein
MAVISQERRRRARPFLAVFVLATLWCGPNLCASDTAKPPATVDRGGGGSVNDLDDEENGAVEVDPALCLQLLSAILIVSGDDGSTSSSVRTPLTTTIITTGDTGGIVGQGGTTPTAPEPASLVLGALGTGMALVVGVVRRRRKNAAAE